jgi:hypothetical protein
MQVKIKFPTSDAEPYLTVVDGNCGYDAAANAHNTYSTSCLPSDYAAADLKLGRDNTSITTDDLRQLVFDTSSITNSDYEVIISAMKVTTTTKHSQTEVVHEGEWFYRWIYI